MRISDDLLTRLIHGDVTCWSIDDAVAYGRAVAALMEGDIAVDEALIGSCTCNTKTPDPSWHSRQCRYRLILQVQAHLWLQQQRRSSLIDLSDEKALDAFFAHQNGEQHE